MLAGAGAGRDSIRSEAQMSLWHEFVTNDGKMIHKWTQYFPVYERYFSRYRDKSLIFLEIGVARRGSLGMWQRYFGPMARIVGIDIDERCKKIEAPGIFVRIGDQTDETFLQSLIDEFGAQDIVLDDGSHNQKDITQTFHFLYPKMPKNGIYMVEDLHGAYWEMHGGGLSKPDTFINISKRFIDELNAHHTRGQVAPTVITRRQYRSTFTTASSSSRRGTCRAGRHRTTLTSRFPVCDLRAAGVPELLGD